MSSSTAPLSSRWLGGSLINHCLIMGDIGYNYLINVLMPWTVGMIPWFYRPPPPGVVSLVTAEITIAFIVFIASAYALWCYDKKCMFFLLWYIIFYLPVSNLIPLSNPMAHRYMYLPSIGLLIVLAVFLHKAFKSAFLKKHSPYLSSILYGAVIMICITRTLLLNGDWKSNFDMGWAWVRDYPAAYQGYATLGREYLSAGNLDKAKKYLEKSILLGNQMPSDALTLSECYIRLGKIQAAKALLRKTILSFPDYADAYFYLGEIYYAQKNYPSAQEMLEKTLMLNPKSEAAKNLLKLDLQKQK